MRRLLYIVCLLGVFWLNVIYVEYQFFLLLVLTLCFAAIDRREAIDRTSAVVLRDAVAVKSSPDQNSTDLFILHEGTKVEISDRLNGWCEITIADGKKGWMECSTFETI